MGFPEGCVYKNAPEGKEKSAMGKPFVLRTLL
jgi:hypothetical protein